MVKIITDSTCDMTAERLAALDIEMVPLTVHFGDAAYADKRDLDNSTFYQMLRQAKTLPTTSQVNPADFEAVFRRQLDAGHTVVGLFLSSKLSGTVQSAHIAAEMIGSKDIYVIDSLTTTLGLSLLLELAAARRDAGASAAELAAELEVLSRKVLIYAVVDTLKYLKMGGRLSAASAAIGEFLGISPVISLNGGLVESVGKGRGKVAAYGKMGELYRAATPDMGYPVSVGHTDTPTEMARVLEALGGVYDPARVIENEIGSIIGTHVGPGAAGVAFICK